MEGEFLKELKALDEFRLRFRARHPEAQLERDDPDVRRLLESLAFFTMRTRMLAQHNLVATWRRLFANYFDFLLAPMPAMAMVQAQVTLRRTEVGVLARGSEIKVTAPDGTVGTFRTLADLRVLPVRLERVQVLLLPSGGFRLVLDLHAASGTRSEQLGMLRLHVRYLDDYVTSLRALYNLRVHLQKTTVVYDQSVDEKTVGAPCQVSFGSLPEASDSAEGEPHPIETVRSFFHFPEQELFLNVQIPPAQRAWSHVSLCLDLGSDWPRSPAPSPDLFQLGVVPVINLRREGAQPITLDGTQDAYPIRYPLPGREYELRALRGVYVKDPKDKARGPVPLRHGVLPGVNTSETYEIEEREDPSGTTPWIILRMPEAFASPKLVLIDATWHQPRFDEHATGRLKVTLVDRTLEGLEWRVVGPVRPHVDSPMRGNALALIETLSMNMKAVLELDEVRALLGWLGTVRDGAFRALPAKLRELRSEQAPDSALRGIGIRHIYHIKLEGYDPDDEALVHTFLMQVRALLDSWNQAAAVELHADTSGSPLQLPVQ